MFSKVSHEGTQKKVSTKQLFRIQVELSVLVYCIQNSSSFRPQPELENGSKKEITMLFYITFVMSPCTLLLYCVSVVKQQG